MSQIAPVARPRSEGEYTSLKQASKRLVKASGGLEAAAMVTRVGHSELARYYNLSEKLFMPVDVAADLEAISGNPLVSRCLAHMLGFALIPIKHQLTVEPSHHWTALLANLGEETASVLRQVGAALMDHGTLTPQSINNYQLTRHLDSLIQAAMQLTAAVTHRQDRGSLPRPLSPRSSDALVKQKS
ncbi:MAG: hypothetical protein EXR08_08560 [Alphaproteobacteria bacterium]|nr:hypothetical protein [Alphaproteobacteria bacterium]